MKRGQAAARVAGRSPANLPKPVKRLSRAGRTLAGALAVVMIAAAGFVLVPQFQAGRSWRQAEEALARRDFDTAREHLQRCLEVWPTNAQTHFTLARTLRRGGDLDRARDHLNQAERFGWPPESVHLERLLAQAQVGVVAAVEKMVAAYLGHSADEDQVILEALVLGCLQSNVLERAYHWSSFWIAQHPDDAQGRFYRGFVLERGFKDELAVEEYRLSVERNPVHSEARLRYGEALVRLGRHADAVPHFEQLLRDRPNHAGALLGLARCQQVLNSPEETRTTLERLLEAQPNNSGGLLLRGQMELERDHPQEALLWLREAEKLAPYDRETLHNLARALQHLERLEEAKSYFEKHLQVDRDQKQVEKLIKEIIEQPKNADLRFEAGTLLLRLGQEDRGARMLLSALLVDSRHEPTRKALAEFLPKLGDAQLTERFRRLIANR